MKKRKGIMKRKGVCFVLALVCICTLFMVPGPTKMNAASSIDIELNATAISKNQVKLSWKKKSVSSYKIYRATVNKNDTCGKFKKIATVSKSKTSYTNKVSYKQKYYYRIDGYKNGKIIYQGVQDVYTGVPACDMYDEYEFSETKISPTAIPLNWHAENGLKPAGYEIYRSENGKTYKKIKTLKKSSSYRYTDKTVKAGHTYYYKVRAYRIMSGKKVYGKYSGRAKLSAVNQFGIYDVKPLVDKTVSSSAVSIAITSDKLNGTMEFFDSKFYATCTFEAKDGTTKEECYVAKPVMYSLDGSVWKDVEDEKLCALKAGETIYLRFCFYDAPKSPSVMVPGQEDSSETIFPTESPAQENSSKEIDLTTASTVTFKNHVTYNGFMSAIEFTLPQDKSFTTELLGEYYH